MEIETDNHSYYFVDKRQNELSTEILKPTQQDSLERDEEDSQCADNSTLSTKSSETNEELEDDESETSNNLNNQQERNNENIVYHHKESCNHTVKKDGSKVVDEISNIDSQDIMIDKYDLRDIKNYVDSFNTSPTIHKYSSALDILSSYLKGQKVLYLESRDLYKSYLNFLMIPCIFMSSLCTVLSQLETKNTVQPISLYVSIINALITFLLAFINYLKLDACAESYRICSNQFEKLQQNVTFLSGEVLLFSHPFLDDSTLRRNEKIWKMINPDEEEIDCDFYKAFYKTYTYEETKMIDSLKLKIKEIKHKILEAKETNQFPIPQKIQRNYPIITFINIFSTIKKLDDYQNLLIIRLKNTKNKIQYLLQKEKLIYSGHTDLSLSEEHMKSEHVDDMRRNEPPPPPPPVSSSPPTSQSSTNTKEETLRLIKKELNRAFEIKDKLIQQIMFLKTSHTIIDNIFQQEIVNNHIRKKCRTRFFILHNIGCCLPRSIKERLYPRNYKDPKKVNPFIFKILYDSSHDMMNKQEQNYI